jgi:hypothetical protein
MILLEPNKKQDKAKITFVIAHDEDNPADVFVAGDFNCWNPGANLLRRRGSVRSVSLTLATGRRYAFRYYQGGRWFNDKEAHDYEATGYGQTNGIIDLTTPSWISPSPA